MSVKEGLLLGGFIEKGEWKEEWGQECMPSRAWASPAVEQVLHLRFDYRLALFV